MPSRPAAPARLLFRRGAAPVKRLGILLAVGVVLVGGALAAYPGLKKRQLIAELNGCERHGAGPRAELIEALGDESAPFFRKLLQDPHPGARLQAFEAVLEIEGKPAAASLLPMFADYHSRIRERVVEEAQEVESPEALRLLLAASADPDQVVRLQGLAAVCRRLERPELRSPELVSAVAARVQDPSPDIQSLAVATLRKLSGQDFGFRLREDAASREQALARLTGWLKARYPKLPAPPAAAPPERTDLAPRFDFIDIRHERWNMDLMAGRTVLLHFFGTWCGPCVEEMKTLQTVQRAFPDTQILALGVNEKGPDALKRFGEEHGITFPMGQATDAIMGAYGEPHEVPVTYLIDPGGQIRRRYDGARDFATYAAALKTFDRPPSVFGGLPGVGPQ